MSRDPNPAHTGGARMRAIAGHRLASATAMRALADEQPKVLAAIDAAARGEIGPAEAEELLGAHLAAREACIASMRAFDDEWRALSGDAAAWSGADAGEIHDASRAVLGLLAEIESNDARFAGELSARRNAARSEMSRADSGRAAQRAYGSGGGVGGAPRFTDRKG